jgi:hypothetical protein
MLKRNIALFIAGGLLSAQVGLTAADQGNFPSNDTGVIWKPLPAQVEYFKQREASNPNLTGASRPVFATSTGVGGPAAFPGLAKYLADREAAVRGDVYKTIKVEASTKNVTVEHLGTVKFANDKGQSFVWTCDSLGEHVVPLKAIAPAGFAAGDIMIYVRHPASHIQG